MGNVKTNIGNIDLSKISTTKENAKKGNYLSENKIVEEYWTDLEVESMDDDIYLVTKDGEAMGWINKDAIQTEDNQRDSDSKAKDSKSKKEKQVSEEKSEVAKDSIAENSKKGGIAEKEVVPENSEAKVAENNFQETSSNDQGLGSFFQGAQENVSKSIAGAGEIGNSILDGIGNLFKKPTVEITYPGEPTISVEYTTMKEDEHGNKTYYNGDKVQKVEYPDGTFGEYIYNLKGVRNGYYHYYLDGTYTVEFKDEEGDDCIERYDSPRKLLSKEKVYWYEERTGDVEKENPQNSIIYIKIMEKEYFDDNGERIKKEQYNNDALFKYTVREGEFDTSYYSDGEKICSQKLDGTLKEYYDSSGAYSTEEVDENGGTTYKSYNPDGSLRYIRYPNGERHVYD